MMPSDRSPTRPSTTMPARLPTRPLAATAEPTDRRSPRVRVVPPECVRVGRSVTRRHHDGAADTATHAVAGSVPHERETTMHTNLSPMTSRRTLLTRLVAATTGAVGLAFGSGAFSQVKADRDFDVSLAGDEQSQLVIEENPDLDSSAATIDEETETFSLDASGLPSSARASLGAFENITNPETLDTGVFLIRNENETGGDVDIGVSVAFDEDPDDENQLVEVALLPPEGTPQTTSTDAEGAAIVESVPSTESEEQPSEDEATVECGIIVDSADPEQLDIELSIEAVRSDAGIEIGSD